MRLNLYMVINMRILAIFLLILCHSAYSQVKSGVEVSDGISVSNGVSCLVGIQIGDVTVGEELSICDTATRLVFYANMSSDFDTSCVAGDCFVNSWSDLCNPDIKLIQDVGANRPIHKDTLVDFNGGYSLYNTSILDTLQDSNRGTWIIRTTRRTGSTSSNLRFMDTDNTFFQIYYRSQSGDKIRFQHTNAFRLESNNAISFDTVGTIALRQDGDPDIFVNGQEVASTFLLSTAKFNWFDNGNYKEFRVFGSDGIAEIRIYNRELSDTEILNIHNSYE